MQAKPQFKLADAALLAASASKQCDKEHTNRGWGQFPIGLGYLGWSLKLAHSATLPHLPYQDARHKDSATLSERLLIDYVSGSIALLRGKLILPCLSLLFVALEAALWDALVRNGVSRLSERVTYKATRWDFKKTGGKLIFTIDGSDKELKDLDAAVGVYPPAGFLISRVSGFENSKVILRVEIEENLWGYFASGIEEKKELSSEKGLSEAVHRARKSTIMKTVPVQLDDTIIRLRNNLIHLSLDGRFDPHIPIPGGGYLKDHEELRREPRTASFLVRLVVDLINEIYTVP